MWINHKIHDIIYVLCTYQKSYTEISTGYPQIYPQFFSQKNWLLKTIFIIFLIDIFLSIYDELQADFPRSKGAAKEMRKKRAVAPKSHKSAAWKGESEYRQTSSTIISITSVSLLAALLVARMPLVGRVAIQSHAAKWDPFPQKAGNSGCNTSILDLMRTKFIIGLLDF